MKRALLTLSGAAATAAVALPASAHAASTCVVPSVTGHSTSYAEKLLRHDHCGVGHVSGHGTVVTTQSLKAHGRHRAGTKVSLSVGYTTTSLAEAKFYLSEMEPETYESYDVITAELYHGSKAVTGEPVSFKVEDRTTHKTVVSFKGTSGDAAACTVTTTLSADQKTRTVVGQAVGTYPACAMAPTVFTQGDTTVIYSTFAGSTGYYGSRDTIGSGF